MDEKDPNTAAPVVGDVVPDMSVDDVLKAIRSSAASAASRQIDHLDPLRQAQVDDLKSDTELRKLYAKGFIWLLGAQLLAMNAVFVAVGLGWLVFNDATHLSLFMGGTLAQVFGVVFVITRSLFARRAPKPTQVTRSASPSAR